MVLANPVLQGAASSILFGLIQKGVSGILTSSLDEKIKDSVEKAFHEVSDKYPIYNHIEGMTFWDYVIKKTSYNMEFKHISETEINKVFSSVWKELIERNKAEHDLEEVVDYFWHSLICEMSLDEELYRQMDLSYSKDRNDDLSQIKKKMDDIMVLINPNKEKDTEKYRKDLLSYISTIHERSSEKLRGDLIEREYLCDNGEGLSINDIADSDSNSLILGEPGSGKTYSINRILYELTTLSKEDDIHRIPILLELSAYGYSYSSIFDGILSMLQKYIPYIKIEEIKQLLREGAFKILLDGLDEVNQSYYTKCIMDIKEIMTHSSSNKYIVSCRENIYSSELDDFVKKLKVAPLSRVQIEEYLAKNFGIKHYEITEEQYKLFENPLLLSIGQDYTIDIYGNRRRATNRRGVFEKYIKGLSYEWNKKKGLGIDRTISYAEMVELLSDIAFNMFEKLSIKSTKLEKMIKEKFPQKNVGDIYEKVINSGILDTENRIWFRHDSFKEYFAGCFIAENIEETGNFNILSGIINERKWYEVIKFVVGMFEERELQEKLLDYILENNIKLYMDCIEEKTDFGQEISQKSIEEISKDYLNTLLSSYEAILEKYFYQIKHAFNPIYGNVSDEVRIGIVGCLSEDKKHITYSFRRISDGEERVIVVFDESFDKLKEYHKDKMALRCQTSSRNLDMSGLSVDSARVIAVKEIKSNLKSIVEKRLLNENPILISERIEDMKKSLPVRDCNDLENIRKWIKDRIEEFKVKSGSDLKNLKSFSYGNVELIHLLFLIDYMIDLGERYGKYILPKSDIDIKSGWTWDFYSKERLLERVGKFFYYSQLTFIDLVENNFNPIKEHFHAYTSLPYKYVVNIKFKDEADRDYSSEPSLCYYRCATNSLEDKIPEVRVVEELFGFDTYKEEIDMSFKSNGRLTESISISNTGVSMTITGRTRGDKPISDKVYDMVKKSLEDVFGRL